MRAVLDDQTAPLEHYACQGGGERGQRAKFESRPSSLPYLRTEYDAESAKTGLTAQNFGKRAAEPRRRGRNPYPGRFHGGDLRFGVPAPARDDGARMPHAAA